MQDTLISFETAKLAKEKRFDIKVNHQWGIEYDWDKKKLIGNPHLSEKELYNYNSEIYIKGCSYSAPTQSLLQKWLREKHNIHINVVPKEVSNVIYFGCSIYKLGIYGFDIKILCKYKFYEQALEKGLYKALKLIKNE